MFLPHILSGIRPEQFLPGDPKSPDYEGKYGKEPDM